MIRDFASEQFYVDDSDSEPVTKKKHKSKSNKGTKTANTAAIVGFTLPNEAK